jgi:hypothetical protein
MERMLPHPFEVDYIGEHNVRRNADYIAFADDAVDEAVRSLLYRLIDRLDSFHGLHTSPIYQKEW